MKIKRFVVCAIAVIMAVLLVSCGNDAVKTNTETETAEKNAPVDFTIDGYEISYKSFDILKDKYGQDAIAVHYTFKNTGKEPAAFGWSFIYDMKQANKDIFSTIVPVSEGSEEALGDSADVKVAPGESCDVTVTYALKNIETPVDISMNSFNDFTQEFTHTIYINEKAE